MLWALLLAWLARFVGAEALRELLLRLKRVEVAGLRFDVESGVESAAAASRQKVPWKERKDLAQRLRLAQPRIAETRFLWIDDNPAGNKAELRLLNGLGASIDLACSDDEARERLDAAIYDIVLSDIRRGESAKAGVEFLPVIAQAMLEPPVIFYVIESKGKPEGAFGIATRPDELMHLIVDALDRPER